ncbi:MAG: energy transducer TonB [Azonexus sp.]
MTRTTSRLALAAIMSLLLHILPFVGELIHFQPPPSPPPPLQAELRPARPLPPPPALELDKPAPPQPVTPRKPTLAQASRSKTSIPTWQQEVRRQLKKQQENGQFYPAEAIAQGLEGEVLVLMLLDEQGRVAAARVEQGSGHRLLDDAALKAIRALHSVPAEAPREAILPVSFKLR